MKIIDVKMTNLWYIAALAVCDQWTGLLDWLNLVFLMFAIQHSVCRFQPPTTYNMG